MSRTTSAAQLASTEICRGLSAAEIEALYAVSEDVVLGAGQVLFPESSPGEAAFVVLTGEVEVLKKDKAGLERSLARLGSGAVLGEMSLIRPDAKRSAAARTTAACTLLRVPAPAFQGLLAQGNVGALKVVHNFARVLSKRLASVDERVVELLGQTDGGKREELGDFQKLLTNWSF